ncbi:DUF6843 domain-containing protein [Laceyella tengchongensis]
MKYVFVFIMSSILTILSVGCTKENHFDLVFLIPKGFTGWVYAVGDIPGKKALVKEDGKWLVPISHDGQLRTCTSLDGEGGVEFYFVDEKGKRTKAHMEYETIDWVPKKGVIYVQGFHSVGREDEKGEYPTMQQFFVGTAQQYEESLYRNQHEQYPDDIPPLNSSKQNACK